MNSHTLCYARRQKARTYAAMLRWGYAVVRFVERGCGGRCGEYVNILWTFVLRAAGEAAGNGGQRADSAGGARGGRSVRREGSGKRVLAREWSRRGGRVRQGLRWG